MRGVRHVPLTLSIQVNGVTVRVNTNCSAINLDNKGIGAKGTLEAVAAMLLRGLEITRMFITIFDIRYSDRTTFCEREGDREGESGRGVGEGEGEGERVGGEGRGRGRGRGR